MDEKEKRKTTLINIILAILAIGIIVYQIFFNKTDSIENDVKENKENVSIVTNPNDFYTVSSCVSKYLNYLNAKDNEKLMILLSNEYKNKNSITIDNIDDYVDYLDNRYSFNPRKMYHQELNKGIDKFYVYGYIQKESINYETPSDYYIIVILDRSHLSFEIEPYDGSLFK